MQGHGHGGGGYGQGGPHYPQQGYPQPDAAAQQPASHPQHYQAPQSAPPGGHHPAPAGPAFPAPAGQGPVAPTAPDDRRRAMKEAKRTQVAQAALDFSDFFSAMMKNVRVAGQVSRRPVLVAPEGMSTAGGQQARQSILLQPEAVDASAANSVTVGWVDIPKRQALLRTHLCLERMHQQRFPGRKFDVDRTTYQTFFANAQQLLAGRGIHCNVENTPPGVETPTEATPVETGWTTASVMLTVALFFMLGAAAGAAGMYVYLQ